MKITARPGLAIGAVYGLVALICSTFLANMVTEVPNLIAEPMKHDLSLSDTQIGALRGGAVTMVSALAAFPIGWLADRVDRRWLFAVCILIWSVSVSSAGFAGSYSLFFVCWMGVALGEAAINPITFSMIPDLFPKRRLLAVNNVFFITQLVGTGAGLWICGALLANMGAWKTSFPPALAGLADWRLTLVALGLPGPLVALMILFMPARPRPEQVDKVPKTEFLAYLKTYRRTLFPLFIGFGFVGGANGALFGWAAISLVRLFGESPAQVGMRLAPIFAVCSVSGVVIGGLLVRLLRRRFEDRAVLSAAAICGSVLVVISALYLFATSATQVYAIVGAQALVAMATLALGPTTVQSVVPATIRGRMFAVTGFIYVGYLAAAPVLIGAISDALGPAPRNLIFAMVSVALPSIALGVFSLLMGQRTLAGVLEAVRLADEPETGETR